MITMQKTTRLTKRQREAYTDMLMGRALRISETGNFVSLNEAVAKIRAGI